MSYKIRALCLFVIGIQLVVLTQCAPIEAFGVEETRLLSGSASTTISCIVYSGVNSRTIKWFRNRQEIVVDNDKYRLSPNTYSRLEIRDITSTDEGLYSCSYESNGSLMNIVYIYISGFAGFLSPETTTTIDAFSGDMVELDTRVNYTGAGSSNHNQTVTVLHLYKLMDNSRSLVYFCGNENSRQGTPCPSTNTVTATSGTYKYDLTLYLNNVTRNDGGRYQARVELLRPGVSSRSYIRKEFVIQVHQPIEVNVLREEKTLRCQVPLIDVNVDALTLAWQNPLGETLSSSDNVLLSSKETLIEASLTAEFQALTNGNYSCVATVNTSGISRTWTSILAVTSNSVSIGNSTDNQSSLFQVTIGPVSSLECSLWYDADKSAAMEATIRRGIALSVSQRCNCEVVAEDIVMGQLSCQGDWLSYKSSVDASREKKEAILAGIDDWTGSDEPSITLGLFSLQVNSQCSGRTPKTC